MNVKRFVLNLLGCLLLVLTTLTPAAFADTPLPDGAVKGLPERLAALDDEGRAVNSATGEYFFRVEGMKLGETYTKNVQLMNLYENNYYHIYFYVEPLFKSGEIDLETGCTCRFLLDGVEFYSGNVNGAGNIDLTESYDLGYFAPGDSRVLRCEVTFNEMSVDKEIDFGHRLVDRDGEHIIRGRSGDGYIYGEIEFKWIFYAEIVGQGGSHGTIPGTDQPGIVTPGVITPGDDTPDDDKPGTETPGTDTPGTDTPGTDTPGDDTPGDDTPGTDIPGTDTPGGETPGGDKPVTPPRTGIVIEEGGFWIGAMAVILALIIVMLFLIVREKKLSARKTENTAEKGKRE